MKDVIEPNYYLELKETLRKELTQFLLRLKDEQNQEIWLLTPMMDQTSYQQKKWLTPILNWGLMWSPRKLKVISDLVAWYLKWLRGIMLNKLR